MVSDAAWLAIELVSKNPGKYTQIDLIRELRRYRIEEGSDDPGRGSAMHAVLEAMGTGQIYVRGAILSLPVVGFLYPR